MTSAGLLDAAGRHRDRDAARSVVQRLCATVQVCLLSGALGVFTTPGHAQEPPLATAAARLSVTVTPDQPVGEDALHLPHVEPHLAIDPSNSDHVVVAVMVEREGRMSVDVLRSTDGGTTWARRTFPPCFADPWLAFGSFRRLWLTCIGHSDVASPQLVYHSSDGGETWTTPVQLAYGDDAAFDHGSLVVLPGSRDDTVLVVGMQGSNGTDPPLSAPYVARSTDNGASFAQPRRILWSGVMSNAANPVIVESGVIGFPILDFSVDGRTALERRRMWWVRWDDRNERASIPYLITEVGPMSTLPLSAVTTTASGDRILHIAYDDVRGGSPGVWLVSSRDGGRTWTRPEPVVVSASTQQQFANPVVAGNASGSVAVAWYEAAGAEDGCWRVKAVVSTDAGLTFSHPVNVSAVSFCVHQPENRPSRRWPAGGDYFGIAATDTRAFRLIWADSRSGLYQPRTALIRITEEREPE